MDTQMAALFTMRLGHDEAAGNDPETLQWQMPLEDGPLRYALVKVRCTASASVYGQMEAIYHHIGEGYPYLYLRKEGRRGRETEMAAVASLRISRFPAGVKGWTLKIELANTVSSELLCDAEGLARCLRCPSKRLRPPASLSSVLTVTVKAFSSLLREADGKQATRPKRGAGDIPCAESREWRYADNALGHDKLLPRGAARAQRHPPADDTPAADLERQRLLQRALDNGRRRARQRELAEQAALARAPRQVAAGAGA
ncbi:hypothetical protein TOPH_07920, partial [Tolypocladium ophioglossoides CBS 100239]